MSEFMKTNEIKMKTCPKCGSPQVEEQTNYAKETGRTWWVCGTFQTRDCHPHHSELCLEREEKNTLQRKVEELQIHIAELEETLEVKTCTKRENLYAVNEASCKTVAHFVVENGNDPIDPSAEPIPKAKPDWAVKEGYWYEQYQLMRERYHKQMGENSKQAERIRELEEQLQAKLDDLQASTIHSCGDSCSRPMCVLRRERDAYKRAKQENDERFMNERDEAIQDRDQWRCISASLLVYAESLLAHIPDTSEISWTVLEQARAMFKEGEAK